MSSKKSTRSAYWYFVKSKQEKNQASQSLKEAIEQCYTDWKALSKTEREPYERKFKDYKESLKNEKIEVGFKYPTIKSEHTPDFNRYKDRATQMKEELVNFFQKLENQARIKQEPIMDLIKNQKWYFMKFQSFCRSEINPYEKLNYKPYYVLAEIGIVEYSLLEGITNQYHAFIKPGKIPVGYRSQCMDSSKDVHKIPIDNFDQITKTHSEVYADVQNFLKPKQENGFYTPVFCMAQDVEETIFGLKFLRDQSSVEDSFVSSVDFSDQVYDLECLVVHLALFCAAEISNQAAKELLTSYSYDYSTDSRCPYHEDLGEKNCALGFVKRQAFLISDELCPTYGISVTEKHLPVEKPVGTLIHNDNFRTYDYSSRSYSKSSLYSTGSNRGFKNEVPYKKRVYDSNATLYNEDEREEEFENNPMSSLTSLRSADERGSANRLNKPFMPSTDIRYENQPSKQAFKPSTNRKLVADKFESNNPYEDQSAARMNTTDDEDEWTLVDKKKNSNVRNNNQETQSVVSGKSGFGVASSMVSSSNSEVTNKTSSTGRYMGRGMVLRR